ncbi:transglutaminase-like domain-containing protein [Cellulomonas sp. Leaf334]|uniref:transglutaminase-like domain-containing protein n=1 Tax=Cellulomonas sp. Leaf334 TaxID=1736339 RepID=UPI000700BBA2|nr:transglutaminase-like domain-containing protein [Cellulomonas sp. Leaf334]KQR16526.1 transglutaminase [Cellulomonas sp. Leaf334]
MTSRPAGRAAVDVVCLVGTLALVLTPLLQVYGGLTALPALAGGLLLGTTVAVLGAARGWSAITVVAAVVVVFVLAGGALAAPSTTVAGVVPTPSTPLDLARGAASTWKQVLTLQPPVGSDGTLLVAAYLLALVGSCLAVSVALRARTGAAAASAAIVPVVVLVATIVLGTRRPVVAPVVTGVVLVVVLLPWAAWRAGLLRARRVVATGALVAVAVGAAVVGAPVVVGATDRLVVRDEMVPPFDPRDYPSPLSAFREFVKEDLPLFTVTGLPENARVRLATMDRYDGVVWNVAGDGSAQASGEFRRVGSEIDTTVRGDRAHVEFTVDQLAGVWLPTVGQATAFDISDPAAASALRYNDATGGAVLTGGVRPGLEYGIDVVVPREPAATDVGDAPKSDIAQPPLAGVPDVALATAADVARDAGSPVQISEELETWLAQEGYFSHGVQVSGTESLSGHGADRITSLLGGDLMVGDGEQYAAAMALMVREMGLPARVVLGFVPERSVDGGAADGPVEVTGKDVQAWVEVAFQGYGWVPFDPTPPPEQTPQEEDQEKPSEPNPQVVQPPPPPPAAVTPPDEDTEQPQTDDPDETEDGSALFWRIARAAGIAAIPLLLLASPLLVVVALKALRRRRRRRSPDPVARVAGGWDEVLDTARDLRRPAGALATRNESARALAASFADVPDGALVATRVGALARSADHAVFSANEPSGAHATAYWADVQQTVDAMHRSVGWRRRVRARVSTASLKNHRNRRPKGTS